MGTLGYIYTLQKYIIFIATIYNEKLTISFEEVFHQKQFSFTCTIHQQPNKTQLYNKRCFFSKRARNLSIFKFDDELLYIYITL